MEAPTRIREIETLPEYMRDFALVAPETVATLLGTCVPIARKRIKESGIELVALNTRQSHARWGDIRRKVLAAA